MPNRPKSIFEEILVGRDSVLLFFNERDAEIARNWQNHSLPKKIVDRSSPVMI